MGLAFQKKKHKKLNQVVFFKFKNWSTLVQTIDVTINVNTQYMWCVNLV
jgi:hypothetical protein